MNEIVTLGNLELDLGELAEFLVWAKKQGYAGGGKYTPLVNGSKQFTCQRGNFHFSDEYMGESQFPGHEVVRWKIENGQPVWRMNYFGGTVPILLGDKKIIEQIDEVLRLALMQVPLEFPFRGPECFSHKEFLYKNDFKQSHTEKVRFGEVDIKRFSGRETIRMAKSSEPLYFLDYHGGLIIPK